MITLSRAERLALCGAVVLLVLHFVAPLAATLEYRRAMLAAEPWRAFSGHLVHINWAHAGINAAAWWVVARLFASDLGAARQAVVVMVGALAISVGLAALCPSIDWYRGFSGVLHALYFAGSTRWLIADLARTQWRPMGTAVKVLWLPAVLLAGGWIKVLAEQPGSDAMPYAEWLGAATVPQAHLIGAVCGVVLGVLFAARDVRGEKQACEQ